MNLVNIKNKNKIVQPSDTYDINWEWPHIPALQLNQHKCPAIFKGLK